MVNNAAHSPTPRRAILLAVLLATLALFAVASGVFDPPVPEQPVALPERFVSAGPGELPRVLWLDDALPERGVTAVRLTAALQTGAVDSGYGVLFGTPDAHLGVAVSPTGFATVWQQVDGRHTTLLPWQPWVHVRTGLEPNELWWSYIDGDLVARINREIVWRQAAEPGAEVGSVALWVTAFEAPVTVRLIDLAVRETGD